MKYYIWLAVLVTSYVDLPVLAHQPVMDMAPRWKNGYGFQMRYERYGSDTLKMRQQKINNIDGQKRYVSKIWFEGVYTFKPSVRVTFKLPYVDQSRTKLVNNSPVLQNNNGLGDLIIGVPIKRYTNKGNVTSNLGFTPSIRIPTGKSSGIFPLSDGSWDVGLSLAYARSTPKFYQFYDLFYWKNNKGVRGMKEGDEIGLDINWGYHPYHDNATNSGVFIMWDITARHVGQPTLTTLTTTSGGDRISMGPVIVLYRNALMFRAEFKKPVYEKLENTGLSRGNEFKLAVGITF